MVSLLTRCWWRSGDALNEYVCVEQDSEVQVGDADISALITSPRMRVLRELERLAVVAEDGRGLEEARRKLVDYRCGDFWVPTGGLTKEEMDIPQANTILLVGLKGSGKSSLVNLMYSVLGRSGIIPFARICSGKSGEPATTMYLEEHNVARSQKGGFCVFDSRGLERTQLHVGLEELLEWMIDGVRHNQPCTRPGDPPTGDDEDHGGISSPRTCSRFVTRNVNCVVVVVDMAEAYKGIVSDNWKQIEALKEIFTCPPIRNLSERPLVVLTHGDKLLPRERIDGRIKICEALGVTESSGAYDIPCLTEYGILPEESDPVAAYAVAELVYRALLTSDRTHMPRRDVKDWAWFALSTALWLLSTIFRWLGDLCAGTGQGSKKKVRKYM
ncbi:hypothetical protein MLD38_032986 [Melastoma candidum]|uniref:Uncharacterized protein n=1 Tax=Melastoma candidum TaxID=119954 RepID=A0ACB9M9N5_9MYRT|nr:hypothetical protein MLD38_032986 [Melastoma candidum]